MREIGGSIRGLAARSNGDGIRREVARHDRARRHDEHPGAGLEQRHLGRLSTGATLAQDSARDRAARGIRVRGVSWSPRRLVLVPLAVVMLALPASAAAQDSTIPEDGAGVSTTPPVPLPGEPAAAPTAAASLPDTGSDPRMLFLAGAAMSLLGAGLRLRTVDADDY